MLRTPVTISGSSSLGGGQYSINLIWSDSNAAKYLRLGDTVEDRDGFEYKVESWSTLPGDYTPTAQIVASYITADQLPATFGGFNNAAVFTPGQEDVRPAVQTAGTITTQSVTSGQNYRYSISASWFDATSASDVAAGDHILDSSGKVYVVESFTDPNNLSVEEFVLEGQEPSLGSASLYRPTENIKLFQGTPVSDPARTTARNRDDYNIDARIKEIEDQVGGGVSTGELVKTNFTNNTGASISEFIVVSTNSSGYMKILDLSATGDITSYKGLTTETIADAASGGVASSGIIKNITTGFAFGDHLWCAKDGSLTNVEPDIGVGGFVDGDHVLYVGHISRNEDNPAQKDLFLRLQIMGQL
jgi:hypothetical protein